MAKIANGQPLETTTAMPLAVPDDACDRLLAVLYRLAVDGDVRAAKLYLDFSFRKTVERQTGLTLEEVIRLMNSSPAENETDDD